MNIGFCKSLKIMSGRICFKMDNYHVCLVGPVPRDELDDKFPLGEGRIRAVSQDAFHTNFGRWPDICVSGWGVTEEMLDDMRFFWQPDKAKKRIVQSYINEDKPFPTDAIKAYYLLLKYRGELNLEQEEKFMGPEAHAV